MISTTLKKPKERFSKERYQSYSPKNRSRYIEGLIKSFINLNNGVTISQVEKELNLHYDTVVRHIDRLEATGDIYRSVFGKTSVFFGNHKNMHPVGEQELCFDNQIFVFSILENNLGDYLFIQEKLIEPNGASRTKGGIMVPFKEFGLFFSEIKNFLTKYVEEKENEKKVQSKRHKSRLQR